MGEIDLVELNIQLLKMLERRPRISLRELSLILGISAPSVQRRLSELEQSGRIHEFNATAYPSIFGGSFSIVHGFASKPLSASFISSLKKLGMVRRIIYYTNGHVVLAVAHRTSSEIREVLELLQEGPLVERPEVLLIGDVDFFNPTLPKSYISSVPPTSIMTELKPIDFAIIHSLSKDARKPVNKIAAELGISFRTVNKHLNDLTLSRAIHFEVFNFPVDSDDIMFKLRISLSAKTDRKRFIKELSEVSDRFDKYMAFDNSLTSLFVDGYVSHIKEINDILDQVSTLPEVKAVHPDIALNMHFFDTWLDQEVETRSKEFVR